MAPTTPPLLLSWISYLISLHCRESVGLFIKSDEILQFIIVKEFLSARYAATTERSTLITIFASHILAIIKELYLYTWNLRT